MLRFGYVKDTLRHQKCVKEWPSLGIEKFLSETKPVQIVINSPFENFRGFYLEIETIDGQNGTTPIHHKLNLN